MRAMISADNCTSDTISGDTAAIFSLNHSCLFLIANVMSSIPDKSFFSHTVKIAKIHGILRVTPYLSDNRKSYNNTFCLIIII